MCNTSVTFSHDKSSGKTLFIPAESSKHQCEMLTIVICLEITLVDIYKTDISWHLFWVGVGVGQQVM